MYQSHLRIFKKSSFRHAYRKAVAIIRSIPFKVESADDIKPISGIGQKIKEKMIEIVTTGKLRKAEILTVSINFISSFKISFRMMSNNKQLKH